MRAQLMGLVEKYDLVNRTYEIFWKNYEYYLKENPVEAAENGFVNRESIEKPVLTNIKFILTGVDRNDTCVMQLIALDLEWRHKDKEQSAMWRYQCVFDLNGEVNDDYFRKER
ncbi:MAG: hypothetical protein K2K57_03705 [Oscillospiraceae bacterium]|nr:hypothetical protein [Oscillospiraceae bacterium]